METLFEKSRTFFKTTREHISRPRMSTTDHMFFATRLSFLIRADVTLLESLEMLHAQTRNTQQKNILNKLISDVSTGLSLSGSMKKQNGVFGEFMLNIIDVGENSGILAQNLEYISDELQKKQILKRKILGACMYPLIVTMATVGITSFLMIYLFPKIMPVFTSLHMHLPLSTRIVIATSQFIQHDGLFIILGCILLIILFMTLHTQNATFRLHTDRTLIRIPLIGTAIQQYNLANFTRTTGLLIKSGLTISEAIPISAHTTINSAYRKEFHTLATLINRGATMSEYLASSPSLFPDTLIQITSVGERSGNLSQSFIYLSEHYEREIDEFTKNLSNSIEPILMVTMGLIIGFIAVAIITPIYSITQNLHT